MTVPLGPLALPVGPLLFVLVFAMALLTAALSARGHARAACGALFDVLLVGLIGARIGFVMLYFDQYTGHWLSTLDIRDRGFSASVGIPVALAFTVFLAVRRQPLRRPLAMAAVAALFSGALLHNLAQGLHGGDMRVPSVALIRLSDGATVNLAEQGATKPRVVNLWASWCPPCRREMPLLEQARRDNPRVTFQLVNQGEGGDAVRAFLGDQSLPTQPVLLDLHRDLSRAVGTAGLPTTLFFNARGELIDTHMGELSRATLHRYLQKIAVPAAAPPNASASPSSLP